MNEHDPTFGSGTYPISLGEDSVLDTQVVLLDVTDSDDGSDGKTGRSGSLLDHSDGCHGQ